jgi:NADH pyrophosphatase NudC (nudix superfamily)
MFRKLIDKLFRANEQEIAFTALPALQFKKTNVVIIKKVFVEEEEKDTDKDTCCICLEELIGSTFDAMGYASRIVELRCTHKFCRKCIEDWYKTSLEKKLPSCPCCRRVIKRADIFPTINYHIQACNYYPYITPLPIIHTNSHNRYPPIYRREQEFDPSIPSAPPMEYTDYQFPGAVPSAPDEFD